MVLSFNKGGTILYIQEVALRQNLVVMDHVENVNCGALSLGLVVGRSGRWEVAAASRGQQHKR